MASKESMELRGVIARNQRWDLIVGTVGLLATALGVIILTLLFLDLVLDGWRRLTPEFFLNFPSRRPEEAGILSAWVGTALVMIVTAFTAVPLGVAAAIYLEEYAPKNWITELIEINVTNLAAVPSIIYGLLALGLFVYILGFGHSILTAGLTLGLMILPIIIVATREALRAIPVAIREAAYALGTPKWKVIIMVTLRAARAGVITGVLLAVARIAGETAPLLFTALNNQFWNSDLSKPMASLPVTIFKFAMSPYENWQQLAWAGVFLITVAVLGLNILARFVTRQK